MRRIGAGALVVVGTVVVFLCESFAVFRLAPAYEEMIRTGDGAAFGWGLLTVLWWFVPALIALVAGGVLLRGARGLRSAFCRRLLAVLAWAAGALALVWAVSPACSFVRGTCGWYVGDLGTHVLVLVLGLLLGWAGVWFWSRA